MKRKIICAFMVMAFIGNGFLYPSVLMAETNKERHTKLLLTHKENLNKILLEYRALPKSGSVKQLVDMDKQLRALVGGVEAIFQEHLDKNGGTIINEELPEGIGTIGDCCEDIGLFTGHWSGKLNYSGKLLAEAHSRNPNSPYRKYTLFGTIHGENTEMDMPDIKQAQLYLEEFPSGPFAEKTHVVLGYLYSDLSKVLNSYVESNTCTLDWLCDCFEKYVTKEPYRKQLKRSIALTITHMEKAIALNPTSKENEYWREILDANKSGGPHHEWNWCPD